MHGVDKLAKNHGTDLVVQGHHMYFRPNFMNWMLFVDTPVGLLSVEMRAIGNPPAPTNPEPFEAVMLKALSALNLG